MTLLHKDAPPTLLYAFVSIFFLAWAITGINEIEKEGSLGDNRGMLYFFLISGFISALMGAIPIPDMIAWTVWSMLSNIVVFSLIIRHVSPTKKGFGSLLFLLTLFSTTIDYNLPPISEWKKNMNPNVLLRQKIIRR